MLFEAIETGPLGANCYIVWDEAAKEGMVVDPGDEPGRIIEFIRGKGLAINYIICTHAHFDHVGAAPEVKKETGGKIAIHEAELEIYSGARDQAAFWGYELEPLPPPDILLKDGDELATGAMSFRVIHTPGHSPGGICLFGEGIVLTGDTLFAGSIGRSDFYGGNHGLILKSLEKLAGLPGGTRVLPGHGPSSSIKEEVETNPFYEDLH
ncbi:MAG: MBL fold metallo-hydrolase [Nitrospiraceae bacterium]|nr:MBL fold metallo-hydrolase [Nitrospiraceae bacterium]